MKYNKEDKQGVCLTALQLNAATEESCTSINVIDYVIFYTNCIHTVKIKQDAFASQRFNCGQWLSLRTKT